MRAAVLLVAAAACHHAVVPAPTTGAIAGLVRDEATGTALAKAELAIQRDGELRPATLATGDDGGYDLERLPPGSYDVTASYAGVSIDERAVIVAAGHTTAVDLDLPLGQPEAHHVEFGDPHAADLRTFRAPKADPATGTIDGTVTDRTTHERVPGAIVTTTSPALAQAIQVITDDRGRFHVPTCPPGQYSVSAYYTVDRHATISVERNLIPVRGGETVEVPLFVETQQ